MANETLLRDIKDRNWADGLLLNALGVPDSVHKGDFGQVTKSLATALVKGDKTAQAKLGKAMLVIIKRDAPEVQNPVEVVKGIGTALVREINDMEAMAGSDDLDGETEVEDSGLLDRGAPLKISMSGPHEGDLWRLADWVKRKQTKRANKFGRRLLQKMIQEGEIPADTRLNDFLAAVLAEAWSNAGVGEDAFSVDGDDNDNNDGGTPPGNNDGGGPNQGGNPGSGPSGGAGGAPGGNNNNRRPPPNQPNQENGDKPRGWDTVVRRVARALANGEEDQAAEIAKEYISTAGLDPTAFDALMNDAARLAERAQARQREQAQPRAAQRPNQAEAPQQMSRQERNRRQNEIVAALLDNDERTARNLASELSFELMEQGADIANTRVEDLLNLAQEQARRTRRRDAALQAANEELEIQQRAAAAGTPEQWLSAQFDLVARAFQDDPARARRMAVDLVRTLQTFADGRWRNLTVDKIIKEVGARLQQEDVALEQELDALAAVAHNQRQLDAELDRVMAALQNSDTKYKKLSRKQLIEMLKKWMAKKKKAKGGKGPRGDGPDKRPPPGGAGAGGAAGTSRPTQNPGTASGGAAPAATGGGGITLTLDHVKQAKWDTFCNVYKFPEDLLEDLKQIATLMVKKGRDSNAVVQEGKAFFLRAKKKGHGKALKNGLHLCVAIEDLLVKRAEGKKLTKAVKLSAADANEAA